MPFLAALALFSGASGPNKVEIDVRLPKLGDSLAERALARAMAAYVREQKAWIRGQAADPENAGARTPFGLYIGPEKSYKTASLASAVLVVSTYTGGAHPMTVFKSFAFDARGRSLTLRDFFRPGADYVGKVGFEILSKLRTNEEAAWVQNGEVRELSREQLATFGVTSAGLTFYFPPYELGPYAAGAFEIPLTWKELGPYFRQPSRSMTGTKAGRGSSSAP